MGDFPYIRLLTSVNEVCEGHHVQDVLLCVGGDGHHHQAGEEEGQGAAEGVAQLAVD